MNDLLYVVYKWVDIVVTAVDPWTLGSPANMLAVAFTTRLLNFAAWMRKEGYAVYSKAFHSLKGKRYHAVRWILANHYLIWNFLVDYLVDEISELGWETQEAEA